MNRETQDKIWACMPKAMRDRIREVRCYFYHPKGRPDPKDPTTYDYFGEIFGTHNLESIEEPEELLMVSRKRVFELTDKYNKEFDSACASNDENKINREHLLWSGRLMAFDDLFGDKRFPDKDGQPKFQKGDKVVNLRNPNRRNEIMTVKEVVYRDNKRPAYTVLEDNLLYGEKDIELYKEEQAKPFREGDKVKIINGDFVGEIKTITEVYPNFYFKLDDITHIEFWGGNLEPYTEEESRNLSQEIANCDKSKPNSLNDMEEKELNLVELLKDAIGEEFYSLTNGNVILKRIDNAESVGKVIRIGDGYCEIHVNILPNGKVTPEGDCILFPSRELYEKYPLEPLAAWKIWSEERKPKFEFSGCMYIFKNRKTVLEEDLPELTFDSLEEAQQALEEVRKTLESFHNRKEGEQ